MKKYLFPALIVAILFAFSHQAHALGEQVAPEIELLRLPLPLGSPSLDAPAQAVPSAPDAVQTATAHGDAALNDNPSSRQELVVVRVEPKKAAFELHLASRTGQAHTLEEWADMAHLAIATNAGMFLPDHLTHTGYMRYNDHVNNSRVVNKFGAFFVAAPKKGSKLPPAAILDRYADNWEQLLPQYNLVMQNYRLIDEKKNPIWPADDRKMAISALGQDKQGRILFLFCPVPMDGNEFARTVLDLPLDVTRLLYLEGGSPAMLLLDTGAGREIWKDRGVINGLLPSTPLPNILGVKSAGKP